MRLHPILPRLLPRQPTSTLRLNLQPTTLLPHHPLLTTTTTMRTSTSLTAAAMSSTVIISTLIAAMTGYYIGKTTGLRTSETISTLRETAKRTPATDDEFTAASDEDEDSDIEGVAGDFEGTAREECKMVLVVRTDLGMAKGKIAAQCSHATLMCYKTAIAHAPALVKRWESRGQTKVAVQAKGGEEELQLLAAKAMSLGVVARIVHDAGRTQIAAGSATVLGLGPAPKSVVDQISGGLKLL